MELAPDAPKPSPPDAARCAGLRWRPDRGLLRIIAARPALILLSLAALGVAVPAHAARVVVLQIGDAPRLAKALSALQSRAGIPADVVRIANRDNGPWDAALAKGDRPAIVIALGLRASDFLVSVRSATQFGLRWDNELLRAVDVRHE